MAKSLAEAIKDKKGFPDERMVTIGDGVEISFGELRQYQEATGQDVAKQLEADRQKIAEERQAIAKAQEEVVNLWTKLQEASSKPQPRAAAEGSDWRKDPFFAPVAEYLQTNIESQQAKQAEH